MKSRSTILTIALGLLICLSASTGVSAQQNRMAALSDLSKSLESLSARVGPAVVQIIVTGYGPGPGTSAAGLLAKQRSSGSGVILDPEGFIITNAHVVDGARKIQVLLAEPQAKSGKLQSILKPQSDVIGAQVVGIDRETDLAVLRIYRSGLPYLTLGNSDNIRQGQLVFAFGSPLGLENSMTMGVVSSAARQLQRDDPMIYIQTDASINPGNSGGPLLSADGEVVGINTLIFSQSGGSEGIGFAAPSNIVKNIYTQIKESGRVLRGMIGVKAQTVTPTLARGLGLPRTWGVVIGDVYPDSPAEKADLRPGDMILAVGGKVMENGRQFDVNLYQKKVGEQVVLRVLRGTDTLVIQPVVMERPNDVNRFIDMVTPERNLIDNLGILGIEIDPQIESIMPPLRRKKGVVVAAMAADRTSWEGSLLPGDVIYEINQQAVTGLKSLRQAVENLTEGDLVLAYVQRGGRLQYIAFELE